MSVLTQHAQSALPAEDKLGAPKKHAAYSYTLGANVGPALFRGINGSIDNAKIIQSVMMQAIAHAIYVTIQQLENVKTQELAAEQTYIDQINGPDKGDQNKINIDIQNLNAVKAKFNNVEQRLTTAQNQQTRAQQSLSQDYANLIQNTSNELDIFQGLIR